MLAKRVACGNSQTTIFGWGIPILVTGIAVEHRSDDVVRTAIQPVRSLLPGLACLVEITTEENTISRESNMQRMTVLCLVDIPNAHARQAQMVYLEGETRCRIILSAASRTSSCRLGAIPETHQKS